LLCENCGHLVPQIDEFGQENDHCPYCGYILISLEEKEKHMTIKELLEMKIHEEYVLDHKVPHCFRVVIRVPGGWIYETWAYKNEMYAGGTTSCFVPEPVCKQPILQTMGYDEQLKTFGQDMPEPDYDKTVQAEKTSLQWKDSTKTKRRIS